MDGEVWLLVSVFALHLTAIRMLSVASCGVPFALFVAHDVSQHRRELNNLYDLFFYIPEVTFQMPVRGRCYCYVQPMPDNYTSTHHA